MITRIEITNFMSHEHTVIEPAAGLTVIVGPNNCGKSAVVAALQCVCDSEDSSHMVRHGERECSVTVQTDDGHTIEWRRKKSSSYLIDGQLFDRLGRGNIPNEVHKALRLPKLESGGEADFDVHFGTQKAPIFLLGSSGASAARFFASSSDAIRLVEMQKLHKEKVASAKAEKQTLERQSKEVNAELELLNPAVAIDDRLAQVELLYDEIDSQNQQIRDAERCAIAWVRESKVYVTYVAECQALSTLEPHPTLHDVAPLESLLRNLNAARQERSAAAARSTALTHLVNPPDIADEAALVQLIDRLSQCQSSAGRSAAIGELLAPLDRPPSLDHEAALEELVVRMERAGRDLAGAKERSSVVAALQPLPAVHDTTSLADFIADFAFARRQVRRQAAVASCLSDVAMPVAPLKTDELFNFLSQLELAQRSVKSLSSELEGIASEAAAAADELRRRVSGSNCPTCGGPLDADRVLACALLEAGGLVHDRP